MFISENRLSRRQLLRGLAIGAGAGILAACAPAPAANAPAANAPAAGAAKATEAPAAASGSSTGASALSGTKSDEMKGKKLELSFAVIAGWPPSQAPIDLFPDFAKFAKDKFGYDVTVKKTEAGFDALFQKIAPTLASKSQEYNIMVSDSQWLGALSEPGWIVKADDVFKQVPELDIEPYSNLVRDTYQVYPDGSSNRWGFPQMPDVQGLFVRRDMLEDAKNQTDYKAKTGKDLPKTRDELLKLTVQDWEPIWGFFADKMKSGGTAIMQSKTYDYFSCAYHPYVYATGGDIWDQKTGSVVGVLNTDANAKQLAYFKTLQKYQPSGSQNYGIGEIIDVFTKGQVFSAFQWLAVGLFMVPKELDGKVFALPHPKVAFDGGPAGVIGAMGGQPWVLNKFNDDDHMRASVDFLKWWYTDDTQKKFLAKGGLPWSKKGVANPLFDGPPPVWFEPFTVMLKDGNSRDFWHLPEYAELLAIQQEGYSGFASDQYKDAKAVLDSIAAKQQAVLLEKGRTTVPIPDALKDAQPK